jgi:hypothetical protein
MNPPAQMPHGLPIGNMQTKNPRHCLREQFIKDLGISIVIFNAAYSANIGVLASIATPVSEGFENLKGLGHPLVENREINE